MAKDIALIFTGGTIGSSVDEHGSRCTDPEAAGSLLLSMFEKKYPALFSQTEFHISRPIDILSENLNFSHWRSLASHFNNMDFSKFDAVIITHGTDTLAYSACFFALVMAGIPIPVYIVSSNHPLANPSANGLFNFAAAVSSILENQFECGVFVPYKNNDGILYMHNASKLMQAGDASDDFYSMGKTADDIEMSFSSGKSDPLTRTPLFQSDLFLNEPKLLCLHPYPGLDYRCVDLSNTDAVLHGFYHSATSSVTGEYNSILDFSRRCGDANVPLFIAPLLDGGRDGELYESTAKMLSHCIVPIRDMTFEMSYVKLAIGLSLGYRDDMLIEFLHENICGEIILTH